MFKIVAFIILIFVALSAIGIIISLISSLASSFIDTAFGTTKFFKKPKVNIKINSSPATRKPDTYRPQINKSKVLRQNLEYDQYRFIRNVFNQEKFFKKMLKCTQNTNDFDRKFSSLYLHALVEISTAINNKDFFRHTNRFILYTKLEKNILPEDKFIKKHALYTRNHCLALFRKEQTFRYKSELSTINEMTGIEFESYTRRVLERLGFKCSATQTTGDFGADIIAVKNGKKVAIQCKRYQGNVGFDALKEAHAAKSYYQCDEAWVITNSGYTKNASKAAPKLNVQLHRIQDIFKQVLPQ